MEYDYCYCELRPEDIMDVGNFVVEINEFKEDSTKYTIYAIGIRGSKKI